MKGYGSRHMKVLLISHNSFSTHQSMGKTFLSLFSGFSKEELCQLYIYPTIPDVDVCSSYYRVTDKDILNSFLKFKTPGGEIDKNKIVNAPSVLFENEKDVDIYKKQGNNDASRRLLRDFMWKMSRWYTKDLQSWLNREKPTCIFLAPGYAKFIYDIAFKIAKKRNIPIITYICDDYYFVKTPRTILGKLQLLLLQKKTNALMNKTSHLVTISTEIKEKYTQKFCVPSTTIMTGTNYEIVNEIQLRENPKAIYYFGNIGCNRYLSLAEIGEELNRINGENKTDFRLEIYTGEKKFDILKVFDEIDSVNLHEFVSGEEFDKIMHASDLLLHTEAFDENSIDLVKHSVSTKIADSLASGIPMIAYGSDCVSSMKHLIRNDCALVATSKETLQEMLLIAFFNKSERERVAVNALKIADKYHNCKVNSDILKQIFKNI